MFCPFITLKMRCYTIGVRFKFSTCPPPLTTTTSNWGRRANPNGPNFFKIRLYPYNMTYVWPLNTHYCAKARLTSLTFIPKLLKMINHAKTKTNYHFKACPWTREVSCILYVIYCNIRMKSLYQIQYTVHNVAYHSLL